MKKLRIAFTASVLMLCMLPMLLLLFGYKNANRENRPLAKLPKLIENGSVNLDFSSEFNKFADDNFALREVLVTACNGVTASVLGDYNGTSAVIGRDGWLYFADTLGDYTGAAVLDDAELDSAARWLAGLQTELEERGTELIFIIAPNKATVCPENMPGYILSAEPSSNLYRLQQLFEKYGVSHIDAAGLLKQAKQTHPVYYMRDSHWNNFGATLVYNACAERLGLETCDPMAYEEVCDHRGDLVNFVYPAAELNETRLVYSYPHSYSPVDHPVNFDMFKVNETVSEVNAFTLVMYHDSFGKSLQPIFSASVGRLVMLKSNSPIYSAEDAASYGADAVIIELVERNLDLLCEYAAKNGG